MMASVATVVYAECGSPEDVVGQFYSQHYSFYYSEPETLKSLVTSEFLSALDRKWRCSGICYIDYDPWLGAQDGDIYEPVVFEIESQIAIIENLDIAIVAMKYVYMILPPYGREIHVVHLVLRKSQDGCWLLHDFITPLGESLSYLFSQE